MSIRPTIAGYHNLSARDSGNGDTALLHLMRRCGFGITVDEWSTARQIGAEAWIEQQLDYQSVDDSALEALIAERLPYVAMGTGELVDGIRSGEVQVLTLAGQLRNATLARALYSPRRLYEMMVDFWSNHFNVPLVDVESAVLKPADDREVIRPHAMGNFSSLLHASAQSPAMLQYLDNHLNSAAGPNENYARELLELHTLGAGGGYTEQDVREVARCFTGWGIATTGQTGLFRYSAADHDPDEKEVLGTRIPAGGGQEDGTRVLDMLVAHESTAAHIAYKLGRRFVADEPPETLLERVAQGFLDSGGDIRETLAALLLSDEFFAASGQKFKRPMEYVTSAAAALELPLDETGIGSLMDSLEQLGQAPFGWSGPDGYPDTAADWVSSSALIERWNQGALLGAGQLSRLPVDLSALISAAESAEELADGLIDRLLHQPLGDTDRQLLVDLLEGGGTEFRNRAPAIAALLICSPAFQYR